MKKHSNNTNWPVIGNIFYQSALNGAIPAVVAPLGPNEQSVINKLSTNQLYRELKPLPDFIPIFYHLKIKFSGKIKNP